MVINIVGKIPNSCYLACSGGVDSMFALNYLLKGSRDVEVLHFNHGTEHGTEACKFIKKYCEDNNIKLHIGYIKENTENKTVNEEYWRNARYEFFDKFTDKPIVMAHNLNDNIETYLMSTIKGTAKYIQYSRKNVIRPFLLTPKHYIVDCCIRNNIVWIEDESNNDINSKHSRNKIRNNVIPVLREINPNLEKTFIKKCKEKYKREGLVK